MRVLGALAAGLIIGVILIEAISAGLLVLLPDGWMRVEADGGFGAPVVWPLLPIPALVWLVGGLAGGAMATAMTVRAGWGLAVGLLLALPAYVVVGLITPGNPMAFLAAALPFAGSAAGAAIVVRLQHQQMTVSANDQAV